MNQWTWPIRGFFMSLFILFPLETSSEVDVSGQALKKPVFRESECEQNPEPELEHPLFRSSENSTDTTNWYVQKTTEFRLKDIKPGYIPKKIKLQIRGLQPEQLVKISMNGTTLTLFRADKKKHSVSLSLDFNHINKKNEISVRAVREIPAGSDASATLSVQGVILLTRWNREPPGFRYLRYHLGSCYDLYLPSHLNQEPTYREVLQALRTAFNVYHEPRKIFNKPPAQAKNRKYPFVALGRSFSFPRGHTKFELGPLLFLDYKQNRLFLVKRFERWTVAQLVQTDFNSGLWIAGNPGLISQGNHPPIGQVAVWNQNGLRLRYRPGSQSLIRVTYPQHHGFTDHLFDNRWLLFCLGILGISFITLYLYRQVKRHEPKE